MNKIQIIDDFLDQDEFTKLTTYVVGQKFPWFYIDTVSLPVYDAQFITDPMAVETAGLNHIMYDQEWDVISYTYNHFHGFFRNLEQKLNLKEIDIIRARASLKWPKMGYTENNYNLPHVDYYFPHETLIFYLNDSDGDTFIFDQWFEYTGNNNGIAAEHFTIQQRVTPKENRLVWIDGLQYHTASNPIKNDKRIILNINLKKQ